MPGRNLLTHGIYVDANGASVLVIDSVIKGNGTHGLYVRNGARATVTRATISGNVGGTGIFVWGTTASTTTTADIADSTIDANYVGVAARSEAATVAVRVSVRNSQVVRNSNYGLLAYSSAGDGAPTLSASNNIISNNATGLAALGTGAKVWASGNTVSANAVGLYNSAALFETAGDNAVRNNGTATSGAITGIAPM